MPASKKVKKKQPKQRMNRDDRMRAERASVSFCHSLEYFVTRRAVRARFQSVDMFYADVMAKNEQGQMIWIQTTAGGNQACFSRRKKLETIPWQETDQVFVTQLRKERKGNKFVYYFRVYEFAESDEDGEGRIWWTWNELVEVPRSWFKTKQD